MQWNIEIRTCRVDNHKTKYFLDICYLNFHKQAFQKSPIFQVYNTHTTVARSHWSNLSNLVTCLIPNEKKKLSLNKGLETITSAIKPAVFLSEKPLAALRIWNCGHFDLRTIKATYILSKPKYFNIITKCTF